MIHYLYSKPQNIAVVHCILRFKISDGSDTLEIVMVLLLFCVLEGGAESQKQVVVLGVGPKPKPRSNQEDFVKDKKSCHLFNHCECHPSVRPSIHPFFLLLLLVLKKNVLRHSSW